MLRITAKKFRPYGWVIEYPRKSFQLKNKSLFKVILKEKASRGWRIAYLVLRGRAAGYLEGHPDSYESFEPVKGRAVLFVADKKESSRIRRFLLDRPVILKKGIWHAVACLGREVEIKITENAEVSSRYWQMQHALTIKNYAHIS
jgi:ureidoglycolate hydrolase